MNNQSNIRTYIENLHDYLKYIHYIYVWRATDWSSSNQ